MLPVFHLPGVTDSELDYLTHLVVAFELLCFNSSSFLSFMPVVTAMHFCY